MQKIKKWVKNPEYIITIIGLSLSVLCVFLISAFFKFQESPKGCRRTIVPFLSYVLEYELNHRTNMPLMQIGEEVIYEDLTMSELTQKLDKHLGSTLEGTGKYFAEYTKKTGLDPYLAVSITLLETGCKWGCSGLTSKCYNIGGMKGTPSCGSSGYRQFDSLEDGINGYLDYLYNNYYSQGLTTPEAINPRYATSSLWAEKVNRYIESVRANS